MAVYKFKLFIEDNEDIYREIEILSGQTFEDFINVIQEAYKFDKKHAMVCDDDYKEKDQEITFVLKIYLWIRKKKKKEKVFLPKT